jgi:hypothetical protein
MATKKIYFIKKVADDLLGKLYQIKFVEWEAFEKPGT